MFKFKEPVADGVWLEARTDKVDENYVSKGLNESTAFYIWCVTEHSEYKIGHFYLTTLPGCCGIVVSHYAYLDPEYRHSELSQPFRGIKHNLALHLGYSFMIATTDMANGPAVGSMNKSNYQIVEQFLNTRTGHTVGVGMKRLK